MFGFVNVRAKLDTLSKYFSKLLFSSPKWAELDDSCTQHTNSDRNTNKH